MAATDSIWSYGMFDQHAGDRYISYLPLAHIYERVVMTSVTYRAMSVGFYRSVLYMPPGSPIGGCQSLLLVFSASQENLLGVTLYRVLNVACIMTL